jgi:uncharacterized protein (TIGR02001 family)
MVQVGRGDPITKGFDMLTSIRSLVAASTLAGVLFVSAPALADEAAPPSDITITGSAAVVSQYRFRGLAQSDNKPAVQAALTLSHSSGFYISTWGSSASAGTAPINIGGTEIDVYGGYTKAIGDTGMTVDVGIYGYLYPGATAGNLYEFYGSLAKSYGPVTAKAGVYFAPAQKVFNFNWTSTARHNTYLYGELGSAIPGTPLSVHSHLGYTTGGFEFGKKYIDYNVGVTYKWKNLALDAALVGTNISRTDTTAAFGAASSVSFHRMTKTTGVVSLTASF